MSEWKTVAVREVADVFDGPHATPAKTDVGPWYLSISSLSNGRFDFSQSAHLSDADLPRWTKRVAPLRGDILFSYETRLGEAAYWEHDVRAALGRRMGLLRPKEGKVEPRYLSYAYLGPQFQEVIRQKTLHGATVNRIPVGEMPSWPILLPSIQTQRAVLDVLDNIDRLIDNNRQRMRTLEEIAKAIFGEWFVHFRYPGHASVPLVDSLLGPIPEGWEAMVASTALTVGPRIKLDGDATHPFMAMGDLDVRSMVCYPSETRNGNTGTKYQNGDTLFARITPSLENGKTGYVQSLAGNEIGLGSTEFIVLRGSKVGSVFTYCLARTEEFRNHAIASMVGASGRQRVRNECFESFLLAVPRVDVADAFEALTQPMFQEVDALYRESARLVAVRDLLLPKLVTGQIDVSGLELDAVLVEPAR